MLFVLTRLCLSQFAKIREERVEEGRLSNLYLPPGAALHPRDGRVGHMAPDGHSHFEPLVEAWRPESSELIHSAVLGEKLVLLSLHFAEETEAQRPRDLPEVKHCPNASPSA